MLYALDYASDPRKFKAIYTFICKILHFFNNNFLKNVALCFEKFWVVGLQHNTVVSTSTLQRELCHPGV